MNAKPKRKYQIDYQYEEDIEKNIWGCDIMAYSKKQALFLFAQKHKNKTYKILQVTDWGVQDYDKKEKTK
jgi:hypothetical protein